MQSKERLALEICSSGDFTNHRSKAARLERSLESHFSCSNAVIAGNESLALIMALAGLKAEGQIAVSACCPNFVHNSIRWAGLEPIVYDSEGGNHLGLDEHIEAVEAEGKKLSAILVCDLWGCNDLATTINYATAKNIKIVVYQCGYFANSKNKRLLYDANQCITVASIGLNSHQVTNNCACIFTNNDVLAENFRNIRSSYGSRSAIQVRATANGRVSEFQAGQAQDFLDNLEATVAHCSELVKRYDQVIRNLQAIKCTQYDRGIQSDFGCYHFSLDKSQLDLAELDNCIRVLKDIAMPLSEIGFYEVDRRTHPKSSRYVQNSFMLPVDQSIRMSQAEVIAQQIGNILSQ